MVRLLICLFVVATVFGQDSVPVRAGDRAPDFDWAKIVRSPESAKYKPNLAGQYSVLQFLPNVTANAQAIGRWNDLIAKFAGSPVQFIWIASEKWSAVEPFLRDHPMNGWLLIDEKNDAARAYGCEMGESVIVDPSGKIVGFIRFLDPRQLSGILDGKAVAIARDAGDDQVVKLLADGKVRLESEPEQLPVPRIPVKPDIPPSYEVHISPSKTNGTEGDSGPDHWVKRGFDLKSIVSQVYGRDPSRVVLPDALDNGDKYDFVVVLPNPEDQKAIDQLVQHAIEKQFRVSAVVESKPADVYVMTAIKGKTPPAKTGDESFGGGFTSSSGFDFSLPAGTPHTPEAIHKALEEIMKHPEAVGISNISAGNTTIDGFRQNLERSLGRPIVDETGLAGSYDLEVQGNAKTTEEFIRMLREQTGLVLTAASRSVEFLTLRQLN
jgi:uncharacterized protein (TIGR03435 family)